MRVWSVGNIIFAHRHLKSRGGAEGREKLNLPCSFVTALPCKGQKAPKGNLPIMGAAIPMSFLRAY